MKTIQKLLFFAGVVSFLGALLGIGQDIGDILWRLGVAIMLTDLCLALVWRAPGGFPLDSTEHRQGNLP